MELVNKTPLAAQAFVINLEGAPERLCLLVAKATFCVNDNGDCKIDTEQPFPLFPKDQETSLGILPRDNFPKKEGFDVIVLGNAYAPNGKATVEMTVSLSVGEEKRSLAVFGDRMWENDAISSPKAFTVMPLTYEHAFGGATEVLIDKDSFVTITEPLNPQGKGHNPAPQAKAFAKEIRAPAGYPKIPDKRSLPNIEDIEHLITSADDRPTPVYWATVPLSSAIHAIRTAGFTREELENDPPPKMKPMPSPGFYKRAHPMWDLSQAPEKNAKIFLKGMTSTGELRFSFPSIEIKAEGIFADKKGKGELKPDTLVILPEEKRFYIVYRTGFSYKYKPQEQRVLRLTAISS